jgi:HTH-type transcriptional regulator/antitoxin HigA
MQSVPTMPGTIVKEEMEERGWSQVELAEILGRPPRLVNEVLAGKRAITPETAQGLASAFGTSAVMWLNLEAHWRLSRLQLTDDSVERRSTLYKLFPVKEMQRRGWIRSTGSLDSIEQDFKKFFRIQEIGAQRNVQLVFRRSTSITTSVQDAWLTRVEQLARSQKVKPFSASGVSSCIDKLKQLLSDPKEVRHVPKILHDAGIRFVIVEPLPATKIDGVCMWLDEKSPVIGLSIRFDRIDWFWFTLFHELIHVKHGDGIKQKVIVDTQLVGEDDESGDLPDYELRADSEAQECLVPKKELENFISRVRPLYSFDRIVGFAERLQVHPGIIVGQLHR